MKSSEPFLLLASKSESRRLLLEQASIPFMLINQSADEAQCNWNLPLPRVVQDIARHKMEHALIPQGLQEGQICFVLTADTLCQDSKGRLEGKPVDRADAIKKIKQARTGICTAATAFCLDRKRYSNGAWKIDERIEQVVESRYEFIVPDAWIDRYLEHSWGLTASGAIAVELYGGQFLKMVHGSYSAIMGLPLFELREALEQIGFFASYALENIAR